MEIKSVTRYLKTTTALITFMGTLGYQGALGMVTGKDGNDQTFGNSSLHRQSISPVLPHTITPTEIRVKGRPPYLVELLETRISSHPDIILMYNTAVDSDKNTQNSLGLGLFQGKSKIPQNMIEGLSYFKLAADEGVKKSQNDLGPYISKSLYGLQQNVIEGLYCIKLAANQGYKSAWNFLSTIIEITREFYDMMYRWGVYEDPEEGLPSRLKSSKLQKIFKDRYTKIAALCLLVESMEHSKVFPLSSSIVDSANTHTAAKLVKQMGQSKISPLASSIIHFEDTQTTVDVGTQTEPLPTAPITQEMRKQALHNQIVLVYTTFLPNLETAGILNERLVSRLSHLHMGNIQPIIQYPTDVHTPNQKHSICLGEKNLKRLFNLKQSYTVGEAYTIISQYLDHLAQTATPDSRYQEAFSLIRKLRHLKDPLQKPTSNIPNRLGDIIAGASLLRLISIINTNPYDQTLSVSQLNNKMQDLSTAFYELSQSYAHILDNVYGIAPGDYLAVQFYHLTGEKGADSHLLKSTGVTFNRNHLNQLRIDLLTHALRLNYNNIHAKYRLLENVCQDEDDLWDSISFKTLLVSLFTDYMAETRPTYALTSKKGIVAQKFLQHINLW